MWTNLMTRKTFIPVAHGPGNYNSCFLWFKIMTLVRDIIQEKGRMPRIQLRPREEKQTAPNSQINNNLTDKQECNTSFQNVTCSCVLVQVSKYITPNCLYETNLTLNWKSRAHRHKSMLSLLMPVFRLCNNLKGANVNHYPSYADILTRIYFVANFYTYTSFLHKYGEWALSLWIHNILQTAWLCRILCTWRGHLIYWESIFLFRH